jgi:hypothetical protein
LHTGFPALNQSVKALLRLATAAPYGVFYRHPRRTLSSLATLAPTAPQRGPFVEPHFRRVGSAARLAGRIRPPLTYAAGLIYNDA